MKETIYKDTESRKKLSDAENLSSFYNALYNNVFRRVKFFIESQKLNFGNVEIVENLHEDESVIEVTLEIFKKNEQK